jgi:hypothetical protein
VLHEINKIFSSEEGASTFEFIKSNLMEALMDYLTKVPATNSDIGILFSKNFNSTVQNNNF